MARARKQPLYDQLLDLLKHKIEEEMAPNDKLPSERELSQQYGLSRTTIRSTLEELEKLGYIYRRHGQGTFVSNLRGAGESIETAYSFTEQMQALGKVPRTQILAFETIESNKQIAEAMNLPLGTKVYRLLRLRLADEQPMMLEESYLPQANFMGLTLESLQQRPLYELFSEEYHEVIKLAEETFSASLSDQAEATLLALPTGGAVLRLVRHTYNMKNQIIEYTRSVARADQFHYKVRHIRH